MGVFRNSFLVAALGIGGLVYFGCKTEQYVSPYLEIPSSPSIGQGVFPSKIEQRQNELEQMLKDMPHVADIIYFHDVHKKRFYQVMEKEFDTPESHLDDLWKRLYTLDPKADALTLMPNRLLGKGYKSVTIVFSHLYKRITNEKGIKNEKNLESAIKNHEAVHARCNALGIKLGEEKISQEKIGCKMYGWIMELIAHNSELEKIDEGLKVSKDWKDFVIKEFAYYYEELREIALGKHQFSKYAHLALDKVSYDISRDMRTRKPIVRKRK